jgi:hypothetical protein
VTSEKIEAKALAELRTSLSSYRNRLDDKPPSVEGVSADGVHTLRARRTANRADGKNFVWLIAERKTGKTIGQLGMGFAYAPFFVRNGTIFVQAKATATSSKKGVQSRPLSLVALELKSGNELWSRAVRDVSLSGSLPP